jgi:hypothetical protein
MHPCLLVRTGWVWSSRTSECLRGGADTFEWCEGVGGFGGRRRAFGDEFEQD